MKNHRMTLIALACVAAPAFAQSALPMCEEANFDRVQGLFTVINPAPNAINQQCFLTVHPRRASASGARSQAPFLREGNYLIEVSGGGGGGSAGAIRDGGGGGGGAGALSSKSMGYLAPGVYKLTIGTGGQAIATAMANGSDSVFGDGNPTSLTRASSGELVAGFAGADRWTGRTTLLATPGAGGDMGGSRGGSGGDSGPGVEEKAQDGGKQAANVPSVGPGRAGGEVTGAQANAGGGGGAGLGAGGDGQSSGLNSAPSGAGKLGGGGGGGRGGRRDVGPGSAGGNGFIRLSISEPRS